MSAFTPEELALLRAADAEIEAEINHGIEDKWISKWLDDLAINDSLDHKNLASRKKMKAYREAHKEELAEKKKAYYEAHKEELRAYFRAYRNDKRRRINILTKEEQ